MNPTLQEWLSEPFPECTAAREFKIACEAARITRAHCLEVQAARTDRERIKDSFEGLDPLE